MTRDVLSDHPRLRGLVTSLAHRALAAVGEPEIPSSEEKGDATGEESQPGPVAEPETQEQDSPEIPGPPPGAPARFARTAPSTWLAVEDFLATTRLYERLDESDVAEIRRLISENSEFATYYDSIPDEGTRRQMVLAFGIWLGHSSATAKTGLRAARPPKDVHTMAHGATAAAGGLYEADLVVNALASTGLAVDELSDALDFGCSSGRVVRVLASSYPGTRWRGCDPNAGAIAWAKEHLPGIDFFVNGDSPPLLLGEASLDLVYAISIWSHFEPTLGLRWFEEMHRILRPGGHLVLTTHGLTSIEYYGLRYMRTPQQLDEIIGELYRKGWWYAPEFGEEGDWGVAHENWGTAFISPEWLLTNLCPRWRVLEFAPGRNLSNQDAYVLQRV